MAALIIQKISLPVAALLQSPDYSSLILPSTILLLNSSDVYSSWIAIEARLENTLVGLSLSHLNSFDQTAQLHSLVIKDSYRRQGIGKQLFFFTQHLLVNEEKIRSMSLAYEENTLFTHAIERILIAHDWPRAKTYFIRCHFNFETFNPLWLNYHYRLPSSMHFFDWKDLTPADRKYIEYLDYQGRFLPYLSPFQREGLIDFDTSVGLRDHQGHVVGWSITYRPNSSTIQYAILYVDQSFLHTGYGIQLAVESLRRHKQLPIPQALFEINLMEIDPSWWNFVKKRLVPLADQVQQFKWATRLFIT